jgi:hypothetical protein
MTFSKEQQQYARKVFVEECRQKAWGAACIADFVSEQHDKLMADYEKRKREEDADLEAQISAIDTAPDYHTKDNREKRKGLEQRRDIIAQQRQALVAAAGELQQGMRGLYANVENNLAIAKHAETWEWKEAQG